MSQKNIEIKARCNDISVVIDYLDMNSNYDKVGTDHQIDTYFNTTNGSKLKLRQGNIENALVCYKRDNQLGPKQSNISLHHFPINASLSIATEDVKDILKNSNGILVVVDKIRRIYWDSKCAVKVHVDEVKDLGNFIEIEVMDFDGTRDRDEMQELCEFFIKKFNLKDGLISNSYSDLLLNK